MRNLKSILSPCLAGMLLASGACSPARAQTPEPSPVPPVPTVQPSALETQPTGWLDLMAGQGLESWKRLSYPGKTLKEPNIWSWDATSGILRCEGTGTHENLFYHQPFGDGIFHVEWRFTKVEGAHGYNSGVFVRSSEDGSIWHQAQVGDRNVGYIFGVSPKDGAPVWIKIDDHVPQRGKEAGEWNIYEVTCRGKDMTLWINGAVTATWHDCEVSKGFVGLEAEGWLIEFRNLKFKEL